MRAGHTEDRLVLGWREWITLPELGLRLKAKVDTGAKTSALHAFEIESFERDGAEWVRFKIHPKQYRTDVETVCEAPIKDRRVVIDSGGHRELRYFIETPVEVGGRTWRIEISLTSRDDLRFRMLLGRAAIRQAALVDPGRSYLTRKPDRSPKRPGRA